jgi:hypothetical protein
MDRPSKEEDESRSFGSRPKVAPDGDAVRTSPPPAISGLADGRSAGSGRPGQIYRSLNGLNQTLWFDFASGQETYIIVHFGARALSGGSEFVVHGYVTAPRVSLPLWKRFAWKRFSELTRYYSPPEDIVGAVIERARGEIAHADEYLKTWAPSPCIRIDFARPDVQWPSGPASG